MAPGALTQRPGPIASLGSFNGAITLGKLLLSSVCLLILLGASLFQRLALPWSGYDVLGIPRLPYLLIVSQPLVQFFKLFEPSDRMAPHLDAAVVGDLAVWVLQHVVMTVHPVFPPEEAAESAELEGSPILI